MHLKHEESTRSASWLSTPPLPCFSCAQSYQNNCPLIAHNLNQKMEASGHTAIVSKVIWSVFKLVRYWVRWITHFSTFRTTKLPQSTSALRSVLIYMTNNVKRVWSILGIWLPHQLLRKRSLPVRCWVEGYKRGVLCGRSVLHHHFLLLHSFGPHPDNQGRMTLDQRAPCSQLLSSKTVAQRRWWL